MILITLPPVKLDQCEYQMMSLDHGMELSFIPLPAEQMKLLALSLKADEAATFDRTV
jgi:hypothetical protein